MTLYLTRLLGAPIATVGGQTIGHLDDLLADARDSYPPRVMRIAARVDRGSRWLHLEAVRSLGPDLIEIDPAASWQLPARTQQIRLRGQLLDHQIVDLVAGVVTRVNDAILALTPDGLILTGIDVGLAGLARALAPRRGRNLVGRVPPRSDWRRELAWADIDPVESAIDHYQLVNPHAGIRRLSTSAVERILRTLSPRDRLAILAVLDGETVDGVLAIAEPRFRRLLISQLVH